MSAHPALPVLHYHPLSSYCQKVQIAADELGVALDLQLLDLSDPARRAAFLALWPTGKMPLLVDRGRVVPETSVIVEYLQQHHAAMGRALVPPEPDAALTVRLWDRLSDQYLMTPMQACTADRLRPPAERDAGAVAQALQGLALAYGLLEQQLQAQQAQGREWLAGDTFSLADCAAAPALFYAITYRPLAAPQPRLAAYFERLVARPSVARAIDGARPWFRYYPGRDGLARRFFEP